MSALAKAIPKKLDVQKIIPYLAYRPIDVVQKILENTAQMATSVIHYPMKRRFKSCFKMLRRPRLIEIQSTDTGFSNTK